jgi:O-antigen ligase
MTPNRRTSAFLVSAAGVQFTGGALVGASSSAIWPMLAAMLTAVVAVAAPSIALIAAFPGAFGGWRVGPSSIDLSLADTVLLVALVCAVPFVPWRSRTLQSVMKVLALYLLLLSIAAVAQPSVRSAVEVGHRAFLVAAAVMVGAATAVRGGTRLALRVFVAAAMIVALRAIADVATKGVWPPAPAYPFNLQKNNVGALIALAILVTAVRGNRLELPRFARCGTMLVLLAGLACCQARGAAVALAVAVVVAAIWNFRLLLSPLALVGLVLVGLASYAAATRILNDQRDASRFSSVNSRLETYDVALQFWDESPITGVGLKYWRDPNLSTGRGFGEPHDVVVSTLAETGLVGLGALAVLLAGLLSALRRASKPAATLAILALVLKLTDSLFGIFWVAGTLTVPLLFVGLACGDIGEERHLPVVRDLSGHVRSTSVT